MRWVAAAVCQTGRKIGKTSKRTMRLIGIGTASFAEAMLTQVRATIVRDIRLVKDSLIKQLENDTKAGQADTMLKLAEAAKAENEADLPLKEIALREKETEAGIRKTKAEADKMEAEAEAIRAKAMADFLEAVSRLQNEGGDFFADAKNLEQLKGLMPGGESRQRSRP